MSRCAALSISLILLCADAASAQRDPHTGAFTSGVGVRCAFCHDKTSPRAVVMYSVAASMDQMVHGLNAGALRGTGVISCTTCHRGGPNRAIQPPRLPRRLIDAGIAQWPPSLNLGSQMARKSAGVVYRNLKVLNDSSASFVKDAMAVYSASLGVTCDYCHAGTDWSSDVNIRKQRARAMVAMMDTFSTYFDTATAAEFQCYTCHQGATKPPK
jgi:hypothetical protein